MNVDRLPGLDQLENTCEIFRLLMTGLTEDGIRSGSGDSPIPAIYFEEPTSTSGVAVRAYLGVPLAWRLLGAQMLLVARKCGSKAPQQLRGSPG